MHTIVGVSTSVTAFVGAASRGPADTPVRIFSFSDYLRTFGPPLDEVSPMGHAVQHFFINGGSEAVIVRVLGDNAKAASTTFKETLTTGTDVLTLTAIGMGKWANKIGSVGLEAEAHRDGTANPDDLFNVVVRYRTLDPASNTVVVSAIEDHLNLSMSPKHPRYALNVLGSSQLVAASVPDGLPGGQGSSASAGALAAELTIRAPATLRVSVDFGAPADLVLFPTEKGDVSKPLSEVVDAITAAVDDAGLAAAVSLAADTLKIESAATGLDSAVTVTPAQVNDISSALKLGRAYQGAEISGSTAVRPATTPAPQAFADGADGDPVQPGNVVPSQSTADTGIYALNSLLFPRFNLLCLPGRDLGRTTQSWPRPSRTARTSAPSSSSTARRLASPSSRRASEVSRRSASTARSTTRASRSSRRLPGGTTRTLNLPPCGAVAGVMARTDAARGMWKAPAGLRGRDRRRQRH